ncbi:MAG: hypothetical protein GY696_05550, partial [Gammaproteobacteria bacterium]|nr:hypothetical protein [Gammaproteobacteria bacterium]
QLKRIHQLRGLNSRTYTPGCLRCYIRNRYSWLGPLQDPGLLGQLHHNDGWFWRCSIGCPRVRG